MNLRKQLLVANSRNNADVVMRYVQDHPASLNELMACFFSDELIVAQRAAQIVGDLGRACPESLRPWWAEIADASASPVHQAVRRNATRYFSELNLELPKELESKLIEDFIGFVADPNEGVAIAAFSMTFIANRAAHYPEHAARLKRVLVRLMPARSPGFQNRSRKVLKQLSATHQ
jgi:hypothetical protein